MTNIFRQEKGTKAIKDLECLEILRAWKRRAWRRRRKLL